MTVARCASLAVIVFSVIACHRSRPWTAVAPDNRTVVEVKRHRGQLCVWLAGRPQGCHEQVALRWLTFDGSGQHVAYPAGLGSQWTMIHDGAPGATWDEVGRPVLAPRGGRLAYAARQDDRWYVVVDHVPGPRFDRIHAGSITFSATGARVAYSGVRGDSTVNVIDGEPTGSWAAAGPVHFDTQGSRWAHSARIGERWHLVTDAGIGPSFEEIGVVVPGPGGAMPFAGRKADGWHVITGDRSHGPYVAVRGLALSANGSPAFVARTAMGEGVVRPGSATRWHDSVSHHVEAPDDGWAYIAYDSTTISAWLDGRRFGADGVPLDLALGFGGRYAVVLHRDSTSIIVDEDGEHRLDIVVPGTIQFISPSAWTALAGIRRTRELFVVVNGRRVGRRFDWEEITRRIGSGGGSDAIRTWVAAEAALHRP